MLTNALSHERMTPLNSIVNLSDLVRKRCQAFLTSEQPEDINHSARVDGKSKKDKQSTTGAVYVKSQENKAL